MGELKDIRVAVKSLVPGTVTYSNEMRHVRRIWQKQGQVILIPADELQESIYDIGVYNLFHQGYLGIDNPNHRKAIGLDDENYGTNEPFSAEDARKLLMEESNLETFRQKISVLQKGSIEVLSTEAYNLRNVSYDKLNIIKEVLGIDITMMLNNDKDVVPTQEQTKIPAIRR